MSKKSFFWVSTGLLTLIVSLAIAFAEKSPAPPVSPDAPPPPVFVKSSELQWKDASPALPKGAKVAVAFGDPAKGAYAQFVKIPKGYIFRPHYHTQPEWVAVISGRLAAGFGSEIDFNSAKELSAGGSGYIPPGTPHWAMARTEVLFYQYVAGIASVNYLNSADDPRAKPH